MHLLTIYVTEIIGSLMDRVLHKSTKVKLSSVWDNGLDVEECSLPAWVLLDISFDFALRTAGWRDNRGLELLYCARFSLSSSWLKFWSLLSWLLFRTEEVTSEGSGMNEWSMPTGLLDFLETSLDFLVAGNVADFFCTIDDLLEWLISDNFSLLLVICLCMEEV